MMTGLQQMERAWADEQQKRIGNAVAAERERCAKIAEGVAGGWNNTGYGVSVARRIAAAIRESK